LEIPAGRRLRSQLPLVGKTLVANLLRLYASAIEALGPSR